MCDISVIIPAYNSAVYLPRCLNSCLEQSFANIEVIVVNDGSTDNTIEILESYSEADARVKYVNKKNEGLVCARRTGIKEATGAYVFFIDADDYIEKNTLELLYNGFVGFDIIIGDIRIENSDGKPFHFQHHNTFLYDDSYIGILCSYLSKSITPSLCGRLIRRELFQNVIVPSQMTIGEDVIANILLLSLKTIKVKLVNLYLYHYVQYGNSMINSKSQVNLYKRIEYVKWVDKNVCLLCNNNERLKSCLSVFMMSELYAFLRDGGDFSLDKVFLCYLYDNYANMQILKKLSIWQIAFIVTFRHSSFLGQIFRHFFLFLRSFINTFSL